MQAVSDKVSAYVKVTVSRAEVKAFKSRWPCSGLREFNTTFEFDKRNGDLVTIFGQGDYDGPDLLALSQDAQAFASWAFKHNQPEAGKVSS